MDIILKSAEIADSMNCIRRPTHPLTLPLLSHAPLPPLPAVSLTPKTCARCRRLLVTSPPPLPPVLRAVERAAQHGALRTKTVSAVLHPKDGEEGEYEGPA